MAVPNIFGTATAAIPLSQLDSNFATTITLGNTAIQLGNTVTTLNNMTLANVTVSSGSVTLTNITATTANVTTANISGTTTLTNLTASTALALDSSKNIASVTNTGTGNNVLSASPTLTGTVAGASLSLSSLTSGRVPYATTAGLLTDSANLLYSGTDLTVYGLTVGRGAGAISTNTAVGASALAANTTGAINTAVGEQALFSNTTASNNTAVGYQAGYANTTGATNSFFGTGSGGNVTTGSNNVLIGYNAGNTTTALTTGAQNIHVGASTIASAAGVDYEHIIGFNLVGKGASTVFIGNGPCYQGNNGATWSVISDKRLKKNIVDNTVGLSAITQIRVRNFEYRLPEEVTELAEHCAIKKEGVQLGVIAQELQAVLPDCVKTESTGVISVDADNLTWYLVNAIKELKAELDAYKATHP